MSINVSRIVLHEPDHLKIQATLHKLGRDAGARLTLLIDRSGHTMASQGNLQGIDTTALASLAAANLSATDGLAKLIGEPEFSVIYHQGTRQSIYIADVGKRFSLVLVLDGSVAIGMARLKVARAATVVEDIFHAFLRRMKSGQSDRNAADAEVAPQFTDEEIENLMRDLKPEK